MVWLYKVLFLAIWWVQEKERTHSILSWKSLLASRYGLYYQETLRTRENQVNFTHPRSNRFNLVSA